MDEAPLYVMQVFSARREVLVWRWERGS